MRESDQKERASFLSNLDRYLERGLDQMALSQTVERLNRFPFDAELKIVYCNILMKMGKTDEAYELIRELEDTLLKLSGIYVHIGDIHAGKGSHQSAASFYKKFLFLNPDSPLSQEIERKMEALLRNRKTEEAKIAAGKDAGEDTAPVTPHFRTITMADLYIRQGHIDAAADILKEILKNDPGNDSAVQRLREITGGANPEMGHQKNVKATKIIAELEKWTKNVRRMKTHAA
ncbi:MAG: hypothetical protein JW943_03365 [Deltaproteobacteria bacterium]|nr:hypothetical protein [Deltaproteobacteria bacterium]